MKFTVEEALQYSQLGKIEEWIHLFLNSVGYNVPFSEGLKLQKRYFLGPILMELNQLHSCCGPEPEMKYYEPLENWERRVQKLQDLIRNGWEMPPLIVNHDNGYLEINDGNHRVEALRREGIFRFWVILWDSHHQENLMHYRE